MTRKRILLIDDDPGFRGVMKFILWEKGMEPIVSAGGRLGLRLARRLRPDVIVVDMEMPGIKGLELGKLLRDDFRTSHIPLIFLSDAPERSRSTQNTVWDVANAGFVSKSGSISVLTLLVEKMAAQTGCLKG